MPAARSKLAWDHQVVDRAGDGRRHQRHVGGGEAEVADAVAAAAQGVPAVAQAVGDLHDAVGGLADAAAELLLQHGLDLLGATGAFTLVLHTWPQDLHLHIHIHVLVACGGLDAQGHWRTPTRSPTFRFPVHAMSKVFRGKFLDALQRASTSGELAHDPANNQALRQDRLTALKRHDWVVSAFLQRVAGVDLASCPHCRIGRWL